MFPNMIPMFSNPLTIKLRLLENQIQKREPGIPDNQMAMRIQSESIQGEGVESQVGV